MTNDPVVLAHLSYNLQDAHEELERLLKMTGPDGEMDESYFDVKFAHMYWHLNTAWNTRNFTNEELQASDHDETNRHGQFPTDLKPI